MQSLTNVSAFLLRKRLLYHYFHDPILTNGSMVDRPIFFIDDLNFRKMSSRIRAHRNLSMRNDSTEGIVLIVTRKHQLLRYGSVILMVISIICVICGALWAGYAHSEETRQFLEDKKLMESVRNRMKTGRDDDGSSAYSQRHRSRSKAGSSATYDADETTSTSPSQKPRIATLSSISKVKPNAKTNEKKIENDVQEPKSVRESFVPLSWYGLTAMLFMTLVSLMFAYLLFKIYVWLAMFGFTVGASIALCELLSLIWRAIFGSRFDHVRLNLKSVLESHLPDGFWGFCCSCCCCLCYVDAPVWGVVLYFVSLTVSVTWFIFRKDPYIFILYDTLAAILCVYVIRVFRIGSLKWITSLLGALMVYDLFMVFITSLFHSKGCNIMEEAATGGACSDTRVLPPDPYKEQLPAMLVFPDFNNPVLQCYNLAVDLQLPMSFLGFGDVIVPGLLVAYNRIFDISWNRGSPYFLVGVVGYAVGMGATLSALSFMGRSQPALIYLVPFTLIPTHLFAWCSGQWHSMWNGDLTRDNLALGSSKDAVKN